MKRKPKTKKIFCTVVFVLTLAAAYIADAQQAKKTPRIGALLSGSAATASHYIDAFRQGLRDLKQVEGRTVVVDYHWAEGRSDRFAELAAELIRAKVDLILVWGTTAVIAAKQATSTIPIVFVAVGDPVGSGIVASLARPGGNVTGLSTLGPEVAGKRLELLKEVIPKIARVAVLRNAINPASALQLNETQSAARGLGVQLQVVEVRDPSELDSAFAAMTRERAGAFIVLGDPVFLSYRNRIGELAAKHRMPAIYWDSQFVEAQGLMSYGVSIADLFRRAATYVDKILKGTKPADLPVEQPMKFEFVINLKTAKQIGLTIPQWTLQKADKVIK
ncbi:MAG TPA: ABC transporter substrate-binding protein [Candidatus Limnocylindrales bacterium]|nr:ABC transporter substrate-binding protein [Candidatus Limnocylindrales bacterium]